MKIRTYNYDGKTTYVSDKIEMCISAEEAILSIKDGKHAMFWYNNGGPRAFALLNKDTENEGIYQSWNSSGIRTESAFVRCNYDYGETIKFDKNDMVTFYGIDDHGESDNITIEVLPYFADPLNPTQEEQIEVILAFDIPLISWDNKLLRNKYSQQVDLNE